MLLFYLERWLMLKDRDRRWRSSCRWKILTQLSWFLVRFQIQRSPFVPFTRIKPSIDRKSERTTVSTLRRATKSDLLVCFFSCNVDNVNRIDIPTRANTRSVVFNSNGFDLKMEVKVTRGDRHGVRRCPTHISQISCIDSEAIRWSLFEQISCLVDGFFQLVAFDFRLIAVQTQVNIRICSRRKRERFHGLSSTADDKTNYPFQLNPRCLFAPWCRNPSNRECQ